LRAEFVPGEDNHPVFTGCGERPGAARVCDPHVVPELGPMTSHRSTHVSDADDADLHVLAACSNGQAEEATLEEDHIARRRTCRQLRELGQRPLALLRRLRSIGLAQGAPNAVRVQIGAIDGRPGLLSPGLVERSRVDAVEAELVDEGQDHGLGEGIVAGDGESDPILRSFRPAPLRQEVRSDVVEHLHHGSPEHAGNPTRLGARFFDGRDAAVAKRGVVVARVDDDDVARHAAEESLGQVGHVLRVEGHDDEVDVLDGVGDRDRMRSSLLREIGEGRSRRPGSNGLAKPGNWRRKRRDSRSCRPWAAGVRDGHGVPQAGEPARERAADFPGANDADFHVLVPFFPLSVVS
jgi:hypothetical protein